MERARNQIQIEVVNWEKYNPRSDRKSVTWFRLENSIISEPKFFGLSAAQKFVAICLLAEASKQYGKATIHVEWLCDQVKVKESDVRTAIQLLIKNGVIVIPVVSSGIQEDTSGSYVRTYERTNDTNEHICSTEVERTSGLPELAKIWNENSGTLPKVIACNPNSMRRKQSELRWRENPDHAYWQDVVRRIQESDFCMGRSKGSTWRASFDWLIKPDSASKILEGKYANQSSGSTYKGIAELLAEEERQNASA